MNLHKVSFILLGILLCISEVAWGETSRLIPSYQSDQPVYRVYSSGKFETVFPPSNEISSGNLNEIGGVSISPTQQQIAFCKNNDLWVYEVESKVALQLTHIGKPATKKYDSVEVLILGWSNDESKIFFRVSRGFTNSPTKRPEKYGLQFYDMKKADISSVFPFSVKNFGILAWLANGDFLLKNENKISLYDVSSNRESKIFSIGDGFEIGQENLTRDEQWLAFDKHDKAQQTSQLFKVNLKTGDTLPITDKGNWAEYQFPIFSPNGKKIIYEHRPNIKPNFNGTPILPQYDLVIGGKTVYSFEGYRQLYWIDETTIVLINESILTLVDVESGNVKSNYKLR